jgi:putative membrane protein
MLKIKNLLLPRVFYKTKTAIQLRKIQQVNINQSFIQKLIGVYELEVHTAGSATNEVGIKQFHSNWLCS